MRAYGTPAEWGEAGACQSGKTALGVRHRSDLRSQINSLSAAEKADLLDTVSESLEWTPHR
jgi:hypothetical protein